MLINYIIEIPFCRLKHRVMVRGECIHKQINETNKEVTMRCWMKCMASMAYTSRNRTAANIKEERFMKAPYVHCLTNAGIPLMGFLLSLSLSGMLNRAEAHTSVQLPSVASAGMSP